MLEADRYLLDQIRAGSADGWSQLVERYQGRLLAFARGKLPRSADAEDLVQDTFVSFLTGLARFREDASLETYLFTILRRKIISWFRGKQTTICLLQDALPAADREAGSGGADALPAAEPTASWYARRDEQDELHRAALSRAMRTIIDDYKRKLDFRHLQIVEMIFYCQLRNKDIARLAGVSENHVALCKHRCLNEIRTLLATDLGGGATLPGRMDGETGRQGDGGTRRQGDEDFRCEEIPLNDALLSRIWQEERISCLKRSTIGAYLLETLEEGWRDYVKFHLDQLGCAYCRANLADLQEQTRTQPVRAFRDRILQSTVGFLSRK
ncbi:MAG TPA: sigma-70 family RNA polymerase sigma factor [Phycisphaerae bacterium]|jgi:RNA polymerase sigma factor (sigma-70 family)|nr:sigma-70 family RNA polymerase sigma factor [Phycisphaerae bacterium]HOB73157.1 sigma-70 family RNA polymerase sigma factor [Phycisphaerae bacterium]HOJ53328.1 sigma-70 family RNA polymerase sigma factor [Phycisphaerae bacterium]HOL27214.1 sigma-70 family RNA polymerase sigma factor [Phycisphaerae bacterium]HPP21774.1 sigma-70 family RNA polymerase sigma factor [Phycisphaerae bacterium]